MYGNIGEGNNDLYLRFKMEISMCARCREKECWKVNNLALSLSPPDCRSRAIIQTDDQQVGSEANTSNSSMSSPPGRWLVT